MAQDAPVPTPVPALDTQEEPVPHIVVEKPVAPAAVTPVPVPRVQTTAQIQADKALQDQATEDLNTRAADVSAACGSDIKARIDWTHIDPAEINRDSTANVCAAALDAVEEACATPSARPLIGREVRQIVCTAGPTPSVDLHGGTMVYTLDWQSRNPGAFVYEYLMQHL
jgi:hypothetical protein